ncbi:hypothetical protein NOVOSPHI9U_210029 [Novosphingobium sp. 9U]|nr:hypothetical protein NOVOSPHI9U_210029 [Novosphingobium sp. 9U]
MHSQAGTAGVPQVNYQLEYQSERV